MYYVIIFNSIIHIRFYLINCVSIISFQGECVVLRDRKLNIAPAIKKQVRDMNHFAVYSIDEYFII